MWLWKIPRETNRIVKLLLVFYTSAKRRRMGDQLKLCPWTRSLAEQLIGDSKFIEWKACCCCYDVCFNLLLFITNSDLMWRSRSQCLKVTSLTDPLNIVFLIFVVIFDTLKKKLNPHDGWHSKSVAMAIMSRFKSPHCLQSNRKKCWALSLSAVLPEAAGSQDPQVFTLANPCWISPFPSAPDQRHSCCFPPLQIRFEGHCKMSALFHKALIYTGQHPAIIQSRCHVSVLL